MSDIAKTLEERGARYGNFYDQAVTTQLLKTVMQDPVERWGALADDQREALEHIASKIARILNGDPDYVDNWHDIAGYATLVERRLTHNQMMALVKQQTGGT